MPLYEYRCKECGEEFEELMRSQDAQNPPCPACGSPATEKKMSLFGGSVHGTGSGGGCSSSSGFG
jgi:putative FmdB family regulatory protein